MQASCVFIVDSTTVLHLPQGRGKANRIFYLSVPQEALLDVASCLASNAQTQKGWNRIIIEKPFGLDVLSSHRLTQSLLSKYEEKQIYRYLYQPAFFLYCISSSTQSGNLRRPVHNIYMSLIYCQD